MTKFGTKEGDAAVIIVFLVVVLGGIFAVGYFLGSEGTMNICPPCRAMAPNTDLAKIEAHLKVIEEKRCGY